MAMKKAKCNRLENLKTANSPERNGRANEPPSLAAALIMAAEQLGEDGKGRDGLSVF
jgi:hypothetical protein